MSLDTQTEEDRKALPLSARRPMYLDGKLYVGAMRERHTERGVVRLFKYRVNGYWRVVAWLPTCAPKETSALGMLVDEIRFTMNVSEEGK